MAPLDSQMGPWNQEPTPYRRAKHQTRCNIRGEATEERWSTAKNSAKQRCRYRQPMQQITHISKTEEKLRLLLLLLSPFIGIRPTRQTADCKTHSNLAKT